MSSTILCEPQCWGFEHASFNAALLETARLAEPQAKLVFMGEGTQLSAVRAEMARNGRRLQAEQVEWQAIEIPSRQLDGWRRLTAERGWCARVLDAAAAADVDHVILCSLTPTGLLWLKGRLLARRRLVPVLGVLHGILSSVEHVSSRRPWHWAAHLRQVLRMPHPKQLTYLVLGPSIRASLAEVMPGLVSHFEALDHPYFMSTPTAKALERIRPVRFGFLGVAHQGEKGFDKFVRLAKEVIQNPSLPASEFVLDGFLGGGAVAAEGLEEVVGNISSTPLSLDDYGARGRQLTYAIGLAEPDHYRLVASASFLDALRFGKPGIYLRNRYLEHYFERLGDIGYLCDSYEQVRDVVLSIVKDFPETRYREQCENIRRGRQMFEPGALAGALGNILAEGGRRVHAGSPARWRVPLVRSAARAGQGRPKPTAGLKP